MICDEFRRFCVNHISNATRGERAACCRHWRDCGDCQRWNQENPQPMPNARETVEQDMADPEFVATVVS